MTGREVLKVKPKRTEIPAAMPAVLARSFCEAISPTNAQPRLPTTHYISKVQELNGVANRIRTRNVEERPHTGDKDEKVLQSSSFGHETKDTNDEHSHSADYGGYQNDFSTSKFVCEDNETYRC
jgi:hypothetical protein